MDPVQIEPVQIERNAMGMTVVEKTWEIPAYNEKGPITITLRCPPVPAVLVTEPDRGVRSQAFLDQLCAVGAGNRDSAPNGGGRVMFRDVGGWLFDAAELLGGDHLRYAEWSPGTMSLS